MSILLAGYPVTPIHAWLLDRGYEVSAKQTPVTLDDVGRHKWIVSYGLRHIIPRAVCEAGDGMMFNLHISYLPWNRGADPNLWSWVDETPKGVTLHHVAAGLDTGDIVAQQQVYFRGDETLATSYARLREAADNLFIETWPLIETGRARRIPQNKVGTYHRAIDKLALDLPEGNDTQCSTLALQGMKLEKLRSHN